MGPSSQYYDVFMCQALQNSLSLSWNDITELLELLKYKRDFPWLLISCMHILISHYQLPYMVYSLMARPVYGTYINLCVSRYVCCTSWVLTDNVYDEIHTAVCYAPQFRFDWFIKSRTALVSHTY